MNTDLMDTWVVARRRVKTYAGTALHITVFADDTSTAYRIVQHCADKYPQHVTAMIEAWADAYADHACDGRPLVRSLAWARTAPRGSQALMWASEVVTARASGWHELFRRLVTSAPADPHELGAHVCAVLELVAAVLKNIPRGFAAGADEPA